MKLRSRPKKLPVKKTRPAKTSIAANAKRKKTSTKNSCDTSTHWSDKENPKWLSTVQDEERRQGFLELHRLIRSLVPELEPTTDYHGLIGYGVYHYKYKSGREGDHVKISLANNKSAMCIHCCGLKDGKHVVEHFSDRLGKVSTGKSCVRFKRLEDLNRPILEELLAAMASCDTLT